MRSCQASTHLEGAECPVPRTVFDVDTAGVLIVGNQLVDAQYHGVTGDADRLHPQQLQRVDQLAAREYAAMGDRGGIWEVG